MLIIKIFKRDTGNLSSPETAAVAETYFVLDTRESTVKSCRKEGKNFF